MGLGKIWVTYVARVSAQVVEKIGRGTGAKKRNRGQGSFRFFPFHPLYFIFLLCSNFCEITRSEMLARQAKILAAKAAIE